jgi:hypothetical protein
VAESLIMIGGRQHLVTLSTDFREFSHVVLPEPILGGMKCPGRTFFDQANNPLGHPPCLRSLQLSTCKMEARDGIEFPLQSFAEFPFLGEVPPCGLT